MVRKIEFLQQLIQLGSLLPSSQSCYTDLSSANSCNVNENDDFLTVKKSCCGLKVAICGFKIVIITFNDYDDHR